MFPGLGADARVFGPQRALPCRLECAEYPEPESQRETLAHYAHRVAERLPKAPRLFIGGVSLGAMIALEAAPALEAAGVFLIGGCTSHKQISPAFRAVLAASAAMPQRLIRPTLLLAPLAFKVFERLTPLDRKLMTRVLRSHSPAQTRWSCRAILEWECCELRPEAPVYAVHGQNDEIIPLKNVRPDRVVPGGHHLINVQCPAQVNAFIAERLGAQERARRDSVA